MTSLFLPLSLNCKIYSNTASDSVHAGLRFNFLNGASTSFPRHQQRQVHITVAALVANGIQMNVGWTMLLCWASNVGETCEFVHLNVGLVSPAALSLFGHPESIQQTMYKGTSLIGICTSGRWIWWKWFGWGHSMSWVSPVSGAGEHSLLAGWNMLESPILPR